MPDKHLSSQFDSELNAVSTRVMELGGLVESQIRQAIYALSHFSIEVANAALKYQRRHRTIVKPKEAIEFLARLEKFPLNYVGYVLSPLIVAQWAAAMNCSAYDAVYIHLARRLDASLATSDKGQKAAAAAFKVPLWEVQVSAD